MPARTVDDRSPSPATTPRDAIADYLDRHGLARHVEHIEGRDPSDPALMKPNPHPVTRAVAALSAAPGACVLVGDATTDIRAAHAAGTRAIGYATSPAERLHLARAGADATTDSMTDLARHLRRNP